jgi:hypothetical protein
MHLRTPADCESLDLGFPLSDDDRMTDINNQPESDILDMEFPTSSDDDRSNGETLDLGFPPESDDVGEPLDLGFDVDLAPQLANILDTSDSAGTTGMLLDIYMINGLADLKLNLTRRQGSGNGLRQISGE